MRISELEFTTAELLKNAVEISKNKTFMIYMPQQYEETYGDFGSFVNGTSRVLAEKYQINRGDKVATMADNLPVLLHTICSLGNIGAVWVPVNTAFVGESLRYIIDSSDCSCVCVSSKYKHLFPEILSTIKRPVRLLVMEELEEECKPEEKAYNSNVQPHDEFCIIYTSGTTGFPKGAVHTHSSFIKAGIRSEAGLETTDQDRIHMFLPFFHAWAVLVLFGAIYFKAAVIVEDGFHPETYWENIQKYGITQDHWTGNVPTRLLGLTKTEAEERSKIVVFGTLGGVYQTIKERWPRIRFQSVYGFTEHATITQVPSTQIYPGSDGTPVAEDRVFILDEEGKELPPNKVGQIVASCKCGAHFKGYYKNPEATAEVLRGDGDDVYTGDLGSLDDQGHLHYFGREKEAFRVRGEMVSVEYVEHLINKHPKIAESAVIGYIPSDKEALKESDIVTHLVLREGQTLSPQEFHEWAEGNIPRFMRPKYIFFKESLPKTATLRIQRFKLKQEGIDKAVKLF